MRATVCPFFALLSRFGSTGLLRAVKGQYPPGVSFSNGNLHAHRAFTAPVWRDFTGDFGRDLLREHYAAARGSAHRH